jgi:hypothetical protein
MQLTTESESESVVTMWKNSQRHLKHCLYFDFPVCILLWLEKIGAKTFRFALVHSERYRP